MIMKATVTINDEGMLDVNIDGNPPMLAVVGMLEACKTMLLTGELKPTSTPEPEEIPKEDTQ